MAFDAGQPLPRAAERRSNFFPGAGTHLSSLVPPTAADHTVIRQKASFLAPVSRLGTNPAVFDVGGPGAPQSGNCSFRTYHGPFGLEPGPLQWVSQIGDLGSTLGLDDPNDGLQGLLGALLLSSLDGSLESRQLGPETPVGRPLETSSRETPFTPNLDTLKNRDFSTSFSTPVSASSSPEFTVSGLQLPTFQSIWSSDSTPKVSASSVLTKTVIDEYLTPKLNDFRFVENEDPFSPFPARNLSFSADNSVSASPVFMRTEISQPKESSTTHLTPSSGFNFYLTKVKNATFVPSADYNRADFSLDKKNRVLGEVALLKSSDRRKSTEKWPRGEDLEKKPRKGSEGKENRPLHEKQSLKSTNKEKTSRALERLAKDPEKGKSPAPKSMTIEGQTREIRLNLRAPSRSFSQLEAPNSNHAILASLSDHTNVDKNFCSTFYKRNDQGYMFIKESSSSGNSLKVNGSSLKSWVVLKVKLGHSGGPDSSRKVKVDTKYMPIWRPATGGGSGGFGKRHGKKKRVNVLKRFGRKQSEA